MYFVFAKHLYFYSTGIASVTGQNSRAINAVYNLAKNAEPTFSDGHRIECLENATKKRITLGMAWQLQCSIAQLDA